MSITRPWAFWRRVQYGLGFTVLLLCVGGAAFWLFYDDNSSCFDGVQNGVETGVDCGGTCVRICAAAVFPPKVVWAESFEITPGQYNAVAYIDNVNREAATENLEYTFILRSNGAVVAERKGRTILPPGQAYPIFEGRINTNGQTVTDTSIIIAPVTVWQPTTGGADQFSITNISLRGADERPRVDAMIENTALTEARDVEVVTTLFNELGTPLTASQTFVQTIPGRASQDIVFTWPQPITKTVRSCSIPSDVVLGIDLSGSMNNDGLNPPQPLTDAKNAAGAFVKRLGQNDQIGVVTFATDALVPLPLTRDKNQATDTLNGLAITAAAEVGYTNTVGAIERIAAELSSDRHSPDARRAAILLTDGLPTSAAESEEQLVARTIAAATAIEDSGAQLYVIGLGENVDRDFIENLVGNNGTAYFAPSGADLAAIYEEITSALCESGATRIDIIPKTKTNFIPLN